MKKGVKIYIWSWVVMVVLSVLLIVLGRAGYLAPHHKLAQYPTNIEKITKLDLPDIISVESWDNLDRGSSCWDCFGHRSYFAGKLSEDCVQQLELLCKTDSTHWCKNENAGCYEYIDDAWSQGGIYSISCSIYEDYSYVEYYVDEIENFGNVLVVFFVLMVAFIVLFIWGIRIHETNKQR